MLRRCPPACLPGCAPPGFLLFGFFFKIIFFVLLLHLAAPPTPFPATPRVFSTRAAGARLLHAWICGCIFVAGVYRGFPPCIFIFLFASAGAHGISRKMEGLVSEVSRPFVRRGSAAGEPWGDGWLQPCSPIVVERKLGSLPLGPIFFLFYLFIFCFWLLMLFLLSVFLPFSLPPPPGTALGNPRKTSWMPGCSQPLRKGTRPLLAVALVLVNMLLSCSYAELKLWFF